ncbi:hypothetical protein BH10PLA2_BH10PLA2_02830 [soil metagenome]
MIASVLLFLCSAAICPEPPLMSATATSIQNKDGFEQYPGNLEIDTGAILRVEAYKTLVRKLGTALLRPLTKEDRLELRAKFIAASIFVFGKTRFHIWTKSHWQEHVMIFEDIVVEAKEGCTSTTLYFPTDTLSMKIVAKTVEVVIDQRNPNKPKLTARIQFRINIELDEKAEPPSGNYLITSPGRFVLPPRGKTIIWGHSIWNYFVDSIWEY